MERTNYEEPVVHQGDVGTDADRRPPAAMSNPICAIASTMITIKSTNSKRGRYTNSTPKTATTITMMERIVPASTLYSLGVLGRLVIEIYLASSP